MAALASLHCEPCTKKTPRIAPARAKHLLREIPAWRIARGRLVRKLRFRDFRAALRFVNKAGAIAERMQHHPDLSMHDWNRVDVSIWTHAIRGLSMNDFVLAAKIDRAAPGA